MKAKVRVKEWYVDNMCGGSFSTLRECKDHVWMYNETDRVKCFENGGMIVGVSKDEEAVCTVEIKPYKRGGKLRFGRPVRA